MYYAISVIGELVVDLTVGWRGLRFERYGTKFELCLHFREEIEYLCHSTVGVPPQKRPC